MLVVAIGAPDGVHTSVHRADPTLESVVAAIRRLPVDDLVLATRDEESRRVARSARLVLGSERLALLHLDVHLTAWAVVLAGLTTPALPAASARAVADDVLSHVFTRAVVSTVASLEKPAPTFRQHAGSLLPTSAFVVDPGRGTVGRFLGHLGVPDGEMIVVARSPKPVVPEADGLLPHPADVDLGGPHGLRAAEWPAPRWFEVSSLDAPLTSTITNVASGFFRWPACDVCGRAAPESCLFCDVAARSARTGPRGGVAGPTHRPEPLEAIN
ncbi:hypothetical protein [Myceligenerans pegani]|uniref:Uncharacterized protein n=1 Tax=Myceligenerans pegani TaxID=2776917 RepID=A0ABR9N5X1_9MICO|nr:hypothetical protein [Myceligenerans sp. TRM 65318]MBE1878571.1 hypothetical protein [Myceligenerans sp. TRM 65318]MBE3020842.1 hypothetical protein [Myceligenerans sp. TRM 65318]